MNVAMTCDLYISAIPCVPFQDKMKPTLLWESISGSPSEYGLYVLIDGHKFLLGGKFVS